jgi:hypothetical protein
MKKQDFIIIIAAILISAAFTSCRSLARIKGNGDMVTSERAVSAFEKIQIRGSAVVNYHASLEYRVVVTVDSNLEEYTMVYTEGNELKIGTKNEKGKSYSFTNYIVDVYCPKPSAVSVSGSVLFNVIDKINTSTFALAVSGSGKVNGTFECENFSAFITGSGDIESHIECNKFEAAISGASKITVTGSAKDMDVSGSGSMIFTGNEFQTNNANVIISGSGRIRIWVLEYLKATVSGSGSITYRGNPKIDYTGSGSGRLRSET